MSSHRHPTSSFWRAVESTIISALFSIIVGVALVLLAEVPVIGGAFRAVERVGVDTGMLLHTWFVQRRLEDRLGANGALEPAYTFLDIGDAACIDFHQAKSKAEAPSGPANAAQPCRTSHPATPEILRKVLDWVVSKSGAHPRVIVVDALLDESSVNPPNPQSSSAGSIAGFDVPIVAIAPGRWSGQGRTMRLSGVSEGSVLPGSAVTVWASAWDFVDPMVDGDASVRRYWPAQLVQAQSNDVADRLIPTIGFAVAALASDKQSAMSLFRSMASEAFDCHTADVLALAGRFKLDPRLLCTAGYRGDTSGAPPILGQVILFSIRSLATAQAGRTDTGLRTSNDLSLADAIYRHVPVSFDPFTGNMRSLDANWFHDAIVVIGTSASSGNDWHQTPIGSMSGAELIINAARSFRTFPSLERESLWTHLAHKVVLSLEAAVAFSLFWWAIWAISACRGRSERFWVRWLYDAGIVLVFAFGMLVTIVAIAALQTTGLTRIVHEGYLPSDVLTPVLAVGLEGFAEGAKTMLERLEWLAQPITAALAATTVGFGKAVRKDAGRYWTKYSKYFSLYRLRGPFEKGKISPPRSRGSHPPDAAS